MPGKIAVLHLELEPFRARAS